MGQLLTANVATNLYWLSRYLVRVEVLLIEVIEAFDKIIDVDKNAGRVLYEKLGIELRYENASEFLDEAIFGAHGANIYDLMSHVRENAIICRSQLDSEAFGELIKLHELCEHASKSATHTNYRFIDNALSLIDEIWGGLMRREQHQMGGYFIQLGKSVEKVDCHVRLGGEVEMTQSWLEKIDTITRILSPQSQSNTLMYNTPEAVLAEVNGKIETIIG